MSFGLGSGTRDCRSREWGRGTESWFVISSVGSFCLVEEFAADEKEGREQRWETRKQAFCEWIVLTALHSIPSHRLLGLDLGKYVGTSACG